MSSKSEECGCCDEKMIQNVSARTSLFCLRFKRSCPFPWERQQFRGPQPKRGPGRYCTSASCTHSSTVAWSVPQLRPLYGLQTPSGAPSDCEIRGWMHPVQLDTVSCRGGSSSEIGSDGKIIPKDFGSSRHRQVFSRHCS